MSQQQLQLFDSLLGLLDEVELTEHMAIKDSLVWVDYVFRQLGSAGRQDTLDDVQDLCRLYEWWYHVSMKHLTFAKNSPCMIDGVDRIQNIQKTYMKIANAIGEVRQGIARHESSIVTLLASLNKTLSEVSRC